MVQKLTKFAQLPNDEIFNKCHLWTVQSVNSVKQRKPIESQRHLPLYLSLSHSASLFVSYQLECPAESFGTHTHTHTFTPFPPGWGTAVSLFGIRVQCVNNDTFLLVPRVSRSVHSVPLTSWLPSGCAIKFNYFFIAHTHSVTNTHTHRHRKEERAGSWEWSSPVDNGRWWLKLV